MAWATGSTGSSAPCRGRGRGESAARTTGCRPMRRPERAGSLLLRRRNEAVAPRLHAEVREPLLVHELITVRVGHRAHRPGEEAPAARVAREHRADHGGIVPGAELRLTPGKLAAVLVVGAKLLGRGVGFFPLHRRACGDEQN